MLTEEREWVCSAWELHNTGRSVPAPLAASQWARRGLWIEGLRHPGSSTGFGFGRRLRGAVFLDVMRVRLSEPGVLSAVELFSRRRGVGWRVARLSSGGLCGGTDADQHEGHRGPAETRPDAAEAREDRDGNGRGGPRPVRLSSWRHSGAPMRRTTRTVWGLRPTENPH